MEPTPLPLVETKAPVLKLTDPRAPAIWPIPLKPSTPINVDPVRTRPDELPVKVPPALLKSTAPANAAIGRAKASNAINTIRFIATSSQNSKNISSRQIRDFRSPLTGVDH